MASTVGSTSIDPKEQSNNGIDRRTRLSRVCFSLNESFCPHGYIFQRTHFSLWNKVSGVPCKIFFGLEDLRDCSLNEAINVAVLRLLMPSLSSEDLLNQEPLSVSARVFRHPSSKTFLFLGPVFFLDFNQEIFSFLFLSIQDTQN